MPREPACRNCASKKVGCKAVAGSNSCERCARKGIQCERPIPPAVPTNNASRKTACEPCSALSLSALRQLFVPSGASTANASGTQPTLVVDTTAAAASADSAPSSTRSPSRPFWETVLAPSPGVDG
ncbi:hypothetical protein TRAPUB_220 [Trametes pubescens]|uniref:Zn(2)-C6 fungal-type domain-containing protein n=1 Tax=Trametes pubescens TaxID=154538 RepID=A0A1M2VMN8_TRAPU|nr:hypothetical protein TRAPUB_220 [Trametes pubescens]